LGYAMLATPLVETLRGPLGSLPAAILVSGAAALVWALLALRLRWIAGTLGLTLGVLLGAPLLASLPALDPRLLGTTWPTVAALWIVGFTLVLLLAAARTTVQ